MKIMAEKHKSKYKKPENKKPTYRKDLKDYTLDDKEGNLNPKSAGEKIPNLLRKTDKEMQDDGKMYPTYKDDDRLYKDLEDGDYDPKTALKRLKKRQDKEEKDVADVLKDKIENLTREQKERLVREYVRRKLINRLTEAAPGEEPAIEELPMDAPEAEAPATEPAAEVPAETSAPEAPATPAAPAPEEAPAETPAPDASAEMDAPAKEALAIERFSNHLKEEGGNISRLKSIAKVLNATFKEAEPEDVQNFYRMLKTFTIKKLANK
jgi:hypothetical protein